MPLADMRRKQAEETEVAGAVLAASLEDRPPAKRTRAALAAAAAEAAAAAAVTATAALRPAQQQRQQQRQQEGHDAWPSSLARHVLGRQPGEQQQQQQAVGTESGAGSTQQVDRCGSSDPRAAGGVDSKQQAGADGAAQAPAPAAIGAPAPAPAAAPADQPKRGIAHLLAQHEATDAHEREAVLQAAKRRRVERQGVPAPLPSSALQVPDRPSPPVRADDADGHYMFEVGENLAPRFKIMRKFGEGTFGQVLECWDRHRKDYVAVKVIRNIQKYRDAAMIELEVLSTLNKADPSQSQHCVRLLEWFDYRGHVCMVFERLGPSLYDYLRKNNYKPFPLAMARDFIKQMLESVAFMHSLALVHTDLKPENVLVTSLEMSRVQSVPAYGPGSKLGKRVPTSSKVRVIDFGSATFESDYHSSVVSTRHYRAPEIILGLGWSYPADMWSVGCILVELVTGDALFQTHENLEHLAMMQQVLGPMPGQMAIRANEAAQQYFLPGGVLKWPGGAESKKSLRAVQKLRPLDEFLYKHMDESARPHLDSIVKLVRQLMAYLPSTRMTAEEALKHEFFSREL